MYYIGVVIKFGFGMLTVEDPSHTLAAKKKKRKKNKKKNERLEKI